MNKDIKELFLQDNKGKTLTGFFDLRRFAYEGSTLESAAGITKRINAGEFGKPSEDRLPLLRLLKDDIQQLIVFGSSLQTCKDALWSIARFFQFVQEKALSFTVENIENSYFEYAEKLYDDVFIHKNIMQGTAFGYANKVSTVLCRMLEIPRATKLSSRIRLKFKGRTRKAVDRQADKQNLEKTFIFGQFLIDLTKSLSPDAILGELPLTVSIRNEVLHSGKIELLYGVGKKSGGNWELSEDDARDSVQKYRIKLAKKNRARLLAPVTDIADAKLRGYYVKLRIEAEILLFLAMSGMNLAEALQINNTGFKYKPLGDHWQVTGYKNRRGGQVTFKIYKEFKPHLKQYLNFLTYFYPNSEFLFPYINRNGIEEIREHKPEAFYRLRVLSRKNNIPWIPAKVIRATRDNYFLRRSGDEDLAAEVAQHTKEVLRRHYEQPSMQRAVIEATVFWGKNDPLAKKDLVKATSGAECSGSPEPLDGIPKSVVEPNCVNPSGCLWCKHSRDIDSFDYVWSLITFRYLKIIEFSLIIQTGKTPSSIVIDRLTEKISWFRDSNNTRGNWITEAEERIDEGHYHPHFSRAIEFMER